MVDVWPANPSESPDGLPDRRPPTVDRQPPTADRRPGDRSGPARTCQEGRAGPNNGPARPSWAFVRYGRLCTFGPTAFDQAWPAVASQFVDHVMAPRSDGYVFDGLKEPQPVPRVRQSRALFTIDGAT